jgi:small-conductance mechanosensitive channel
LIQTALTLLLVTVCKEEMAAGQVTLASTVAVVVAVVIMLVVVVPLVGMPLVVAVVAEHIAPETLYGTLEIALGMVG